MIVRPRPRFLGLFTVLRGTVLPNVLPQIGGVVGLAVAVAAVKWWHPRAFERFTLAPFALLGTSLSIFLSFRNTACYDRWWEGRRQWGELVVQMRAVARLTVTLLPGDDLAPVRRELLRTLIGFAHALKAHLRGEDEAGAAADWVTVPAGSPNVPEAILAQVAEAVAAQVRTGRTDPGTLHLIAGHLTALSGVQGACERIRSTPLPFAYTLLLQRTAYLFCGLVPFGLVSTLQWATPIVAGVIAYTFFGLDALGVELEDPFGRSANDLPLDALVRSVERDLLAVAGDRVPPPILPIGHVLS